MTQNTASQMTQKHAPAFPSSSDQRPNMCLLFLQTPTNDQTHTHTQSINQRVPVFLVQTPTTDQTHKASIDQHVPAFFHNLLTKM